MWACAGCNEQIDDQFGACWQCGAAHDGKIQAQSDPSVGEPILPNGLRFSEAISQAKTTKTKSEIVLAVMRRYRDAYTSARWLIRLGSLVKLAAIFLAVVSFGTGLLLSALSPFATWISFAIGGFISVSVYVMGVLTSGQGQTNLATLDTAVNTSRHLCDEDVAELIFS